MNLLALVTLSFAVAAQANISVKWAITASGKATLGDCVYSLLHENKLGAKWIKHSTPERTVAICEGRKRNSRCHNNGNSPHFGGGNWTPVGCVQGYTVEYANGHQPESSQDFRNSHGLCSYRPYGDDIGGNRWLNFCDCEEVGVANPCI